ncbi:helix-turn-helix domain-containing protein [Mucisphaera sp.]|uniref:helix-turn-helix domain-containing protein n=1 Tax=Mucisphaera sp. TaxID=2913024 RepID=UPI003D1060C0
MCAKSDIQPQRHAARKAGPALWQLRQFGREANPTGRRYEFHNTRRSPAGLLVIQASLQGHLQIKNHQGTFHAPEKSLILFQYGDDSHYQRPNPTDGPYHCAWIGILGAGVSEHARELTAINGPVIDTTTDPSLITDLEHLIDTADPINEPDQAKLAAASYHYLTRLYHHVTNRQQAKLPPVEQAAQTLYQQPLRPVTVTQIAQRFNVSREHLIRTFTQHHAEAPHAYLTRKRTDQAIQLLTQTSLPLADVTRQAGFSSQHTLARQIRAATGLAPTALRNQHR